METSSIGGSTIRYVPSLNRTMQYGNNKKSINKTTMEKSLNRTMQYGNYHRGDNRRGKQCSLNRTMQYGNEFLVSIFFWIFPCLNRTMQYGNFFRLPKEPRREYSLNRTMQYGNWVRPIHISATYAQFKSYYVVWKPCQCIFYEACRNSFKSYYVVWKPGQEYYNVADDIV